MPDIYNADPPALPQGVSLVDLIDPKPSEHTAQKTGKLEEMKKKVSPAVTLRTATLAKACTDEQDLERVKRELHARHMQAKAECAHLRVSSCDELIALGPSSDAQALAGRLRPADDQVALLADAVDLVEFIRIPAARIARVEAHLALCRIKELAASIDAGLAHSEMLDKLIIAGVFDGGRVGVISEDVERLRAKAKECERQVGLAEDALREERKTQAAVYQNRFTHGMITRVEAAVAIPIYAGHAAQ
jgi:hypothetical protein